MALAKKLTTQQTIENLTAQLKIDFAKKSELPTKVSDLTNDSGFQTASQVETAIAAQVGKAYRPSGSLAFAELPALTADNVGKVYNITDNFTTTSDFIEGAGKAYKAGADVGIVEVEGANEGEVDYKYNVFANFVDTSDLMNKIATPTAGNLVKQTATGHVEDAGIAFGDVVTKVTGGTTGNVVTLDANGKIQDGGVAASNLVQKVASATAGNLAGLNASGETTDSGIAAADVQTKLASNAFTSGNIRTTDANGFAQDGGIAASAIITTADIQDYTQQELAALLADTPAAGE